VFFPLRTTTTRRVHDVRAADLQEEMAGQHFFVPPDPTKTAATRRTSQRAERAIKHSAIARAAQINWGTPSRSPR
jgi:hypothetical protein